MGQVDYLILALSEKLLRTSMMINALNHIHKIDHELITFSDDMDGLEKSSRKCT